LARVNADYQGISFERPYVFKLSWLFKSRIYISDWCWQSSNRVVVQWCLSLWTLY